MSRPVRTLLFSSLYPSGARPMHGIFVETRLRELLKTGGVETRVVAPVPWFPSTDARWGDYARFARTPRRETSQGIEVLHPRYLQLPKVGMATAPLLMALGARRCIRRLIDGGFDFDVIDAHYYYPDGVAAALLGAWFGKPFTVTARGTDINLIPQHHAPRRWLQWAAGRASASIGVSAALVDRMRALAFDPARLHVIRNGVDLERFCMHDRAAMRQALGIVAAPVVLTVGNLHEHKGQRLALEAFALLRRRQPGALLLVVGEGPDRGWLQARVDALGLADAVRLAGTVPNTELARWYSAADALVLASSREGWPNVLLEAMACGTPVVASDVGGVREIVQGPVAGRVLAQRTPEHLADALAALLDGPPERAAVRAHAAQFGWQRTSEDQLALFRALADGPAMRDIALTLIIGFLLLRALRRPEYGAYTWAWLSLMNPHKMAYGFAYSTPWAYATALVTLACLPFSKSRRPLPLNGGVIILLLLWAWMTLTSVLSINNPDQVWDRWIFVSKIHLMLLVTLMLLRSRQQIDTLVWVVVVSIGFFGLKGGIFTVLTGGAYRVWGPPESMMEENNALAVALIIVLPLMYYLRHSASNRWVRLGLLVSMVFVGASILGSQSRGALLGLLAMAVVLGLKSRHPVRFMLGMFMLIGIGVAFMPDSWSDRMDTIQNYATDESALSRLYTWRTLWNVALDRPLVGAGFRADNLMLFDRYAPRDGVYAAFQGQFWVAHSIYFQALGEHGFVGLALYLALWIWVWTAARRVARQATSMAGLQDWVPLLMRMCQVSAIGFCAGGAFLSLMNLDLPLYILAFVTLCQCAVKDQQRLAAAPQPGAATLPGQPLQPAGRAVLP